MNEKKNLIAQSLIQWLPLAAAITGLCGLVYVAVQQDYRQSANDPQIEIAEDAQDALSQGLPPQALATQSQTDMGKSLQPFLIVYSASGTPEVASAVLDGKTPTPPAGVFDFAKAHGQERFTWQPSAQVRIAAVISSYKDGFVLAGRSLREVEKRETSLTLTVGLAWLLLLAISLALKIFAKLLMTKSTAESLPQETKSAG